LRLPLVGEFPKPPAKNPQGFFRLEALALLGLPRVATLAEKIKERTPQQKTLRNFLSP